VTSAREAEVVLEQTLPDLILLDLILPGQNGLLLCAGLNEQFGVPIIICSGSKRQDDAALGLRLGAADFIAKPFSLDDLQARMEAVLQQVGPPLRAGVPSPRRVQQLSTLVIDHAACRVTVGGEVLDLTPTEYRLLCALAARPNQVISSQELADAVWGTHDSAIMRSLAVHMRRLRAKLESMAEPTPRVVTRRGFGYELVDDTASA
jgi:two-component system response regulator MtrA